MGSEMCIRDSVKDACCCASGFTGSCFGPHADNDMAIRLENTTVLKDVATDFIIPSPILRKQISKPVLYRVKISLKARIIGRIDA